MAGSGLVLPVRFFLPQHSMIKSKKQNKQAKSNSNKAGARPKQVQAQAPAAYGSARQSNFGRLKESPYHHREPILTINGSSASAVTTIRMNPGLSEFAPWLSRIASAYESYRVEKLFFEYVTRAGSTKTGRVVMAVDYDALDSAPTSFIQVSNYEDSVATSSWEHAVLRCSPNNLKKVVERYVRDEASVADQDLRLSDIGKFFVWTEGQDNTDAIADIYVNYHLVLRTPQLAESSTGVYGGAVTGSGTMTAANPLGTTATVDAQARGLSVNAASAVTFKQVGTYWIYGYITGTVVTAVTGANVGCTLTGYQSTVNAAGTNLARTYLCVVTTPGATVTFTATATTVTAFVVTVGSTPADSVALVERDPALEHSRDCPITGVSGLSDAQKFALCRCRSACF